MSIWDIIFPKRCVSCSALGQYFCSRCIQTLVAVDVSDTLCSACGKHAIDGATHPRCRTRFGLDGVTSVFWYRGIAKKAIKAIKYRGITDLSPAFVSAIPSSFFAAIPPLDMLVPIPLHISRYHERGFNQAEVLGRLIAQKLNIPMKADILQRIKQTPPQASLRHKDARLKNMTGVFETRGSFAGQRILLVDDVYTTGATMRAAAQVLKRNGAALVWGLSLAR